LEALEALQAPESQPHRNTQTAPHSRTFSLRVRRASA
jgi:hypothetical protein